MVRIVESSKPTYMHIMRLSNFFGLRFYDAGPPACSVANIFGYNHQEYFALTIDQEYKSIQWKTFRNYRHSLKRISMKVRPKDYDQGNDAVPAAPCLHCIKILSFIRLSPF